MHESAPNVADITNGYGGGFPQCGHTDALLVPTQVYGIIRTMWYTQIYIPVSNTLNEKSDQLKYIILTAQCLRYLDCSFSKQDIKLKE